jgi:hypothetical protein
MFNVAIKHAKRDFRTMTFRYAGLIVATAIGLLAPSAASADYCITFHPGKTSADFYGGFWTLRENNFQWIANLDPDQKRAKHAEAIVKFYRMNSHCFAGPVADNATFNYWPVDSRALRGGLGGQDCIFFNNPATLKVVREGSQYRVADGSHSWRIFPTYQDATNAIQIIQQYGFRASCWAGWPAPVMTYFVQ